MQITFINQFYPPDIAPTGIKLKDLAEALANRGHKVSIISSNILYASSHNMLQYEARGNIKIKRIGEKGIYVRNFLKRVSNNFLFSNVVYHELRKMEKVDLVVSLSSPPFINYFVSKSCLARNIPVVHWIMDVYPEALFAARMFSPYSFISVFLKKIMQNTINNARMVVTLSPEMAYTISSLNNSSVEELPQNGKLLPAKKKIYWSWLWPDKLTIDDEQNIENYRVRNGWQEKEIIFMYSGNFGRGHLIRDFLNAALIFAEEKNIRWVFAGDGSRKKEVEKFIAVHPSLKVDLMGHCDNKEVAVHLKSANVHLVSIGHSWEKAIFPSKIQNVFALGIPVIFSGNKATTLSKLISSYDAGWCVRHGDPAEMHNAVREAMDPIRRAAKGHNAMKLARENWNREEQINVMANSLELCYGKADL